MNDPGTSDDAAGTIERMACMELWEGNRKVENSFAMAGISMDLRGRVFHQQVAGGDIYLDSSCASGRITRTLLADVSGHGTLVAEVAAELRELLRRQVNVISQNQLVVELNRGFNRIAGEGGFATALACTYCAPTRSFVVSSAGHPPPLLLRKKLNHWNPLRDGSNDEPRLANTPIGVAGAAAYSSPKTVMEVENVFCVVATLGLKLATVLGAPWEFQACKEYLINDKPTTLKMYSVTLRVR